MCKGLGSTQGIKYRDQMDKMGSQLQVSERVSQIRNEQTEDCPPGNPGSLGVMSS